MWKLKKRERYALIEQDIEAPRKHRGTFYIGPRHVKHHSTKEFVEFSYVTAPNFASEKDCRVFAQNSHVAIEIYGYYVKLFDPDYENVSVYDERFDVQYLFKTKPSENWRSIDYYNPTIQVIPLENGVEIKRIFDTDYGTQTLEISHVVRTGAFLKHTIKFTNKTVDSKTFRVVMKLAGITSAKVKHKDGQDTVTAEKHVVSPFFFVGEDNNHLKLTEYLWSLGVSDEETSEWTATTLKDIVFNVHAQGCKADIIIGNYSLSQDESLLIDPDSDTFYIATGGNDGYTTGRSTSYPTARSTGYGSNDGYGYMMIGQRLTAPNYYVRRTFLKFDTSSIPSGSTIESASLGLYGREDDSDIDFYIRLQKWTGDTPIIDEDHTEYDGTSYDDGLFSTSVFDDAGYNTITISDYDLITKEGDTLICVRSNRDIGSNVPSGMEYVLVYTYEEGAGYIPKLEVTWEAAAPPTGWRKLQYFTEPPTGGAFNKLKFAAEPPVSGAWNQLLYEGE